MKDEKRLYPGDKGYQGGWHFTTVRKDGKEYNVTTVKDANGNIQYMSFTDKHSYR